MVLNAPFSAHDLEDEMSIETELVNNLSVRKRGMLFRRWGPPMIGLGICIAVFHGDDRILRSRELSFDVYDTSSNMELPPWTNSFSDVWEPIEDQDTPFLWNIPQGGANTILNTWSSCLGLVLASSKGAQTTNITLEVQTNIASNIGYLHTPRYVNVNTQNEYWIHQCKQRGLLESGLADVFESEHLTVAANNLFTPTNKARGVVMIRHPVKRVIDYYYYMKDIASAASESSSFEAFVESNQMVDNYVVRLLNGITDANIKITDSHTEVAKEVLRRKFVVSIFEWFDVGMVRLEKYFGWWDKFDVMRNLTVNNCHYSVIESADHYKNAHEVENGDKVFITVMNRNWADMSLYQYAKVLFAEQTKLI